MASSRDRDDPIERNGFEHIGVGPTPLAVEHIGMPATPVRQSLTWHSYGPHGPTMAKREVTTSAEVSQQRVERDEVAVSTEAGDDPHTNGCQH